MRYLYKFKKSVLIELDKLADQVDKCETWSQIVECLEYWLDIARELQKKSECKKKRDHYRIVSTESDEE